MKHCYERCFETLSNKLRLEILEKLQEKPMSVTQLAKKMDAEQSRISHALQRLKKCKYVISTQKGKERIYSINPELPKTKSFKKNKINILEYMDEHINNVCHRECQK